MVALRNVIPSGLALLAGSLMVAAPAAAAPHVLQVGTFHGIPGSFATVQDAVNVAGPGDWVLIAPGDYHEQGAPNAGVLIATPGIHLRGLDRNRVIVDGTRAGATPCSSAPADQVKAVAGGRDGIEVAKVDGVSIENLTVCNFLSDANGERGNEIWWNGGDESGVVGMGSWRGAYLTASSTYYRANDAHAAQYGIFLSNARGPGLMAFAYASNMADAGFYVGACADCDATLRYVRARNNAQGLSMVNAGGRLSIEDSEWDSNHLGIAPASLGSSDPPSPQDGACPDVAGRSCTIIQRNYVHDNNNPNTPFSLGALAAPVGVGIEIVGGRNDVVRQNVIMRNGAWGVLVNDYPDPVQFSIPTYCRGGIVGFSVPAPYDQILGPTVPCYFYATGNRVNDNVLLGNGAFGNATNGDLANLSLPNAGSNCFAGNFGGHAGRPSTVPANLQAISTCGAAWNPDPAQEVPLMAQVLCDAFGPATGLCAGPGYPQPTAPKLLPIPREPTMADACAGVPANSWCRRP